MPFKSEKQRRYLFANEPEIARDWTETYGSKIQKADGGITRLGFQRGGPGGHEDSYEAGKSYEAAARPSSPDRSPREERIMAGPPSSYTPAQVGTLSDPREKKDFFEQSWSGQPNFLGFGGGYRNLRTPSDTSGGYQSRLSQYGGNILSGIMGVVNPFLGMASEGFQKLGPAFNNFRSSQTLEQFRDKMRGYGRTMPVFSNNPSFGGIETLGVEMPRMDGYTDEELESIKGQTTALDPATIIGILQSLKSGASTKKIGEIIIKNQLRKKMQEEMIKNPRSVIS